MTKPNSRDGSLVKKPQPTNHAMKQFVRKFMRLPIGGSFFMDGVEAKDLDFIRKPIKLAGVNVQIRTVAPDSIYLVNGVRVFRCSGRWDSEDL
jgi:hypothetical protein